MVSESDNTAVETLYRIGGGKAAMARRFREWKVDGMRISAKGANARRQTMKEHTGSLGGALDIAPVLRVFLKSESARSIVMASPIILRPVNGATSFWNILWIKSIRPTDIARRCVTSPTRETPAHPREPSGFSRAFDFSN